MSGKNLKIDGKVCPNVTVIKALDTDQNKLVEFVDTSDANATSSDIITGKTAYVDGKKVIGEATAGIDTSDATAIAADIRLGKTAYAKDAKLTGTIEDYDGAASQGSGNYTVKVIDYDGTVLMEKKGNTGDVIELPEAPTHDRLVFQKWSASRTVTDNKVTIGNDNVMVGATYTTASGQNEFDITVTKATGLTVTFNGSGVKDWGDGTSDSQTSHTYTAYGDYMIKWAGVDRIKSNLFGNSASYFLTRARLAGVMFVLANAFTNCYNLTSIVIPEGVTELGSNSFNNCYNLTSIVIPEGVTGLDSSFGNCHNLTSIVIPESITGFDSYEFYNCYNLTSIVIPESVQSLSSNTFINCYNLTSIVIPEGVTVLGTGILQFCYGLTSIVIPDSVTSINSNVLKHCTMLQSVIMPKNIIQIQSEAFATCERLTKYDFSQATAVPTLSDVRAFGSINKICKIVVPDNLYDQWIAATNWSTYADYIYKASEVV